MFAEKKKVVNSWLFGHFGLVFVKKCELYDFVNVLGLAYEEIEASYEPLAEKVGFFSFTQVQFEAECEILLIFHIMFRYVITNIERSEGPALEYYECRFTNKSYI